MALYDENAIADDVQPRKRLRAPFDPNAAPQAEPAPPQAPSVLKAPEPPKAVASAGGPQGGSVAAPPPPPPVPAMAPPPVPPPASAAPAPVAPPMAAAPAPAPVAPIPTLGLGAFSKSLGRNLNVDDLFAPQGVNDRPPQFTADPVHPGLERSGDTVRLAGGVDANTNGAQRALQVGGMGLNPASIAEGQNAVMGPGDTEGRFVNDPTAQANAAATNAEATRILRGDLIPPTPPATPPTPPPAGPQAPPAGPNPLPPPSSPPAPPPQGPWQGPPPVPPTPPSPPPPSGLMAPTDLGGTSVDPGYNVGAGKEEVANLRALSTPSLEPPSAATVQAIDPGSASDLAGQNILPTLTDRFALAKQRFGDYMTQTAPEVEKARRGILKNNASMGRLGSGMLRTDYGNLSDSVDRNARLQQSKLFGDALEGSIGDQANYRNELRGERAFNVGQSENATDRAIQQWQLEQGAENDAFNRNLQLGRFGEENNPANVLTSASASTRAQAQSDQAALMDYFRALAQSQAMAGAGGQAPAGGGSSGGGGVTQELYDAFTNYLRNKGATSGTYAPTASGGPITAKIPSFNPFG